MFPSLNGLYTMAISTSHLAFGYFGFYGLPGKALAQHPGDVTCFFSLNMVKLKHAYIGMTTV